MTTAQRAARLQAIDNEQRNIEDSAERNNGGKFSEEQRRRYDALNAEHAELVRQQASEPLPRRLSHETAGPLPQEQATQPQPRTVWSDARTGREIVTCGPRERFSDRYEETAELSVGRLMRALGTGTWKDAEPEQRYLASMGVSAANGTVLVPEAMSSMIIDLARADSVVFRWGAQSFDMDAESVRIARVADGPAIAIHSENQEITEDNPSFNAVTLYSRTLAGLCKASRELAQDAPNFGALIESELRKSMAVALDSRILTGNGGSDGMRGILNINGIGTTGSVGAIAWEDFHNAAIDIRANNHSPNGVVLHPTILGDAQVLTSGDGTNSAKLWLGPPPSLDDLMFLPTTSMTTANALVGDGTKIIVGFRTQAEIQATTEGAGTFEKHQVAWKVTLRVDAAVTHEAAFHSLTGITT